MPGPDPGDARIAYAATPSGVFKATNAALAWNLVSGGLDGAAAFAIAVNPLSPQRLATGSPPYRIRPVC